MAVKQKTLKLNYQIEVNGKQVTRGYSYEIAKNISNEVAKEVGEMLATVIKDSIEEYTVTTNETL